jgi:hypothetical protein
MKLSFCKLLVFLSFTVSLSVNARVGSGSGFIVSSDGYIVTNHHVIDGVNVIKVKIKGQAKLLDAKVVRLDKRNDLAILKIDGSGFKPMLIQASTSIKRGEKVYAMGFPQVDIQGVEPKLTDGIISSLSGIRDEPTSFQITNPIQPGNSGGPLFTEDGRVIGVIVATLDALSVVKATGTIPQNVNYAIKSNYLLELLNILDADKFKNSSQPGFRTKKFVDVVGDIEKSVVLIVTNTPNTKSTQVDAKPKEAVKPQNPPPRTLETPPKASLSPPSRASETMRAWEESLKKFTIEAPFVAENGSVVPVNIKFDPPLNKGDKFILSINGDYVTEVYVDEGSLWLFQHRVLMKDSQNRIFVNCGPKNCRGEAFNTSATLTAPLQISNSRPGGIRHAISDGAARFLVSADNTNQGTFEVLSTSFKARVMLTKYTVKNPFFGFGASIGAVGSGQICSIYKSNGEQTVCSNR